MECAKLIMQSGITNLVYTTNDNESSPSYCQKLTESEVESIKKLFKLANVTITHLEWIYSRSFVSFSYVIISDLFKYVNIY